MVYLNEESGAIRPRQGATTQNPFTDIDSKDPPLATLAARASSSLEQMRDGLIVGLVGIPGLSKGPLLLKPFWFQCPPIDDVPRTYAWNWNDYGTIDSGVHSQPVSAALDQYSISTLFVDGEERFRIYDGDNVLDMCNTLRAIGDSMKPFQMQFGQPKLWGGWDVVKAVTMRGLSIAEKPGEIDARYVTMSLVEYPDAPALKAKAAPRAGTDPFATKKPGSGSTPSKGSPDPAPTSDVILARLSTASLPADRNTLAKLAKIYYGSASAYRLIAVASGMPNTGPSEDLKVKFGSRKPPPKVTIPKRPS